MRQQLFFEDHLKNFANDGREADGSELPCVCWLLLRVANLQGPGKFGVKGVKLVGGGLCLA